MMGQSHMAAHYPSHPTQSHPTSVHSLKHFRKMTNGLGALEVQAQPNLWANANNFVEMIPASHEHASMR
jgi:hypothetical protein